jgi:hypothetical protein
MEKLGADLHSFINMDRREAIIVLSVEASALLLVLSNNPVISNLLWVGIIDGAIAFHCHKKSKRNAGSQRWVIKS